MSDNTLQFQWIVTIKENLEGMFRDDPNVFVAGDLLWYPVKGAPTIRSAPDAMVVIGRPKGYRGSYKQWLEDGIAPQVVFEVLSPGNRPEEMDQKLEFYDTFGVEEYYLYDPEAVELSGRLRRRKKFRPIIPMDGWTSPRLGIRFDLSGKELVIYRPDGRRFLTFVEWMRREEEARRQAKDARRQAKEAQRQAEEARQEAERLKVKLRELGIDPEA
jgi:Uma2 family endonuclease